MKGHFLPPHQIFYCIFRLIVLDVQNSRGKPGKITGHIIKYESDFCILNTLNQKIKSCKSESLSLLMPLQPVLKLMQKKKKSLVEKQVHLFSFFLHFLCLFKANVKLYSALLIPRFWVSSSNCQNACRGESLFPKAFALLELSLSEFVSLELNDIRILSILEKITFHRLTEF